MFKDGGRKITTLPNDAPDLYATFRLTELLPGISKPVPTKMIYFKVPRFRVPVPTKMIYSKVPRFKVPVPTKIIYFKVSRFNFWVSISLMNIYTDHTGIEPGMNGITVFRPFFSVVCWKIRPFYTGIPIYQYKRVSSENLNCICNPIAICNSHNMFQ